MKANFETGLKICSKCRRELPLENYQKDCTKSDGLSCWCKDCFKKKKSSKEEQDKARRQRQAYYETEKGKECRKRQYEKRKQNEDYKQKAKEYNRQYYLDHKEELGHGDKIKRKVTINEEGVEVLICTKCKKELSLSSFHKDSHSTTGYDTWCKDCRRELQKEKMKTEEFKEYNRKKQKEFRSTEEGREKINKYVRERRSNDPSFKLLSNLRGRLFRTVIGEYRSKTITDLLGCDILKVRQHLESQFEEGMSWENYGEWHIDHIIPCSRFDFINPTHQKICFNWRNLQPLWGKDNNSKRDSLPEGYKELLESIKESLGIEEEIVLKK